MTTAIDSLLTGANAVYLAESYARYLQNPNGVDPSWAALFAGLPDDAVAVLQELQGPSWTRQQSRVIGAAVETRPAGKGKDVVDAAAVKAAAMDSIRARVLMRSYRVRGHLNARFDPLGLEGGSYHPELDPKTYGFTDVDMDRPIWLDDALGFEQATLREIMAALKETYCSSIGVEYMHIQEPDQRHWIQDEIEGKRGQAFLTPDERRQVLDELVRAEGLERFLDKKYTGTKRFGADGAEAMIPLLEEIVRESSRVGVEEIVVGMPHRGRLNVLATVMQKPYIALFSEFQGVSAHPDDVQGSGDVKYHLGTSSDRRVNGGVVHMSLTANPSHLEAVNPVVLGKVRAKQAERGDEARATVMGLLMHGDAAFAGQGLVPETLDLSQLRGYRTGGTVHLIVNNQIGFTTNPSNSRFSPYPSDIAKGVQAPIFHVNGDDPDAVIRVARLAVQYRHRFKRDVVIDMFCYRRHGHNESDEPSFTQPIMYRAIAQHPTTLRIYADRLAAEGVIQAETMDEMVAAFAARLEKDFQASSTYRPNKADWLEGKWKGLVHLVEEEELRDAETAVPEALIHEVGNAITRPPENFAVNSKIIRQLETKKRAIESGQGIDWATAEALGFGTLLAEGTHVRLSGQDCGRGTFSHRHSVLIDQNDERRYFPLSHIRDGQGRFEVMDSPLSEAGVLGFEYGYSLADPTTLVLWEAQFGDFANGAQVIIDQFIASGESKWLRLSGLVMLLPHGYEGQGPEHSSARLERFLQLSAEDNLQVVNLTTPANYFHALRRQMRRNFRKPLIVMSPKSLLRHKLAVSSVADMGPGSRFQRVIPEIDKLTDKKVRRVVLCSGKVYYDLLQGRRDRKIDDVAIVRVEQFYPWPRQTVLKEITRYAKAEVLWCQEEPANMGGWTFVQPRLDYILEELGQSGGRVGYVGRTSKASPATGSAKKHEREQAKIVEEALTAPLASLPLPFRRESNGGSQQHRPA